MTLSLPDPCLVVLCGPAAAGKSTFAAKWFEPTEVLSSDALRATLSDDPDNQTINDETFALLHRILEVRLRLGRMTVVDATNLDADGRAAIKRIGRTARLPVHLVTITGDRALLTQRNAERSRSVPAAVLFEQINTMLGLPATLEKERWDAIHTVDAATIDSMQVARVALPPMRWDERGPFDIVGDVHGCLDELEALLTVLGYADGRHPEGRRLVFLGDLVDRGPASVGVLRLVLPWLEDGRALFVPGNHDDKLWRWLQGRNVSATGGLATTIAEWERLGESEDRSLRARFDRLMTDASPYLWLDAGALLVSHAGLEAGDHGRVGPGVRAFCLYGKTTGKDIDGYPERLDWASDYDPTGPAVVHGHVPVRRAEWRNNTADIDLGAVFGGSLCAVRWPERTFVTVPSGSTWPGVPRWETWT